MAQNFTMPSPEYLAEINNPDICTHTAYAFMVIMTVVYAFFMASRYFYTEKNGWEIWCLYPLSYIVNLVLCVVGILFSRIAGSGRHIEYWIIHDKSVITTHLKVQTAAEALYIAAASLPKICILILYLRIFRDRWARIASWLCMIIVLGNWFITGFIVWLTICQPFPFKWDKTIKEGHCGDSMAAYRWVGVPNILTDLAIMFLPFSILYRLQISRLRKLGLLITFMTGSLGLITTIIRMVGFWTVDLEPDLTYQGVNVMVYTLIEPCSYFICSCLPGTRPLLRKMYKKSGLPSITVLGNNYMPSFDFNTYYPGTSNTNINIVKPAPTHAPAKIGLSINPTAREKVYELESTSASETSSSSSASNSNGGSGTSKDDGNDTGSDHHLVMPIMGTFSTATATKPQGGRKGAYPVAGTDGDRGNGDNGINNGHFIRLDETVTVNYESAGSCVLQEAKKGEGRIRD